MLGPRTNSDINYKQLVNNCVSRRNEEETKIVCKPTELNFSTVNRTAMFVILIESSVNEVIIIIRNIGSIIQSLNSPQSFL